MDQLQGILQKLTKEVTDLEAKKTGLQSEIEQTKIAAQKEIDVEKTKLALEQSKLDKAKAQFNELSKTQCATIKVQVGDIVFTTTPKTLKREPESLIATAVPVNKSSSTSVFFDRDPKMFEPVLVYLRDGVVEKPTKVSTKALERAI